MLYLNSSYLKVGPAVWAACGKDPGYTPSLLLETADRHVHFQDSDLKGEMLARPLDLKELKKEWLNARDAADRLFSQLPEEDLGCLYLDSSNNPVNPEPRQSSFSSLKRHFGCIRGAWPKIS